MIVNTTLTVGSTQTTKEFFSLLRPMRDRGGGGLGADTAAVAAFVGWGRGGREGRGQREGEASVGSGRRGEEGGLRGRWWKHVDMMH